MMSAIKDLALDHLYIINTSDSYYKKSDQISVLGINRLDELAIWENLYIHPCLERLRSIS
jgi:hypothetical protein